MKMKTESKKRYGSFFIKLLKYRVNVKQRNNIILVTGQTGTGKSYSSISLAARCDPTFNTSRITFDAAEFMGVVTRGLTPGRCIILDETGVAVSARSFQSTVNKLISFVNQTYRKKRWTVFFCVPDLSFVDVNIRKLAHFLIESQGVQERKKVAKFKIFKIQVSQRTGKIFYKYPKVKLKNGSVTQLRSVYVKMPPDNIIKTYEKKKDKFITELNKGVLKKLKHKQKVEDTLSPIQQQILKLKKEGKTPAEMFTIVGYKNVQSVYKQLNNISKILGRNVYMPTK